MIWVLPVTGPDKDSGRTCYVCQLGSAPVIAAFIKPDSSKRYNYIEYVQKLYEKHPSLQAFVVILKDYNEVLKQELTNFAKQKNITVPLTLLDPTVGLPDSVPLDVSADVTVLLYRGRFFEQKIECLPDDSIVQTGFLDDALKAKSFHGLENFTKVVGESASLTNDEFPSVFEELDKAAVEMINRP